MHTNFTFEYGNARHASVIKKKLRTRQLVSSPAADAPPDEVPTEEDIIAHVATCTCGWEGNLDHAPDLAGRSRALSTWGRAHALPMLIDLAAGAAEREVMSVLEAYLRRTWPFGLPWPSDDPSTDVLAIARLQVLSTAADREINARVVHAFHNGGSGIFPALSHTRLTSEQIALHYRPRVGGPRGSTRGPSRGTRLWSINWRIASLAKPDPGEHQEARQFVRDDDGKWLADKP